MHPVGRYLIQSTHAYTSRPMTCVLEIMEQTNISASLVSLQPIHMYACGNL